MIAATCTDGIHGQEVHATLHSIHIDVKLLLRSRRNARIKFICSKQAVRTTEMSLLPSNIFQDNEISDV